MTDYLVPCPGCGQNRSADDGHHICRECEGRPGRSYHDGYRAGYLAGLREERLVFL